MCVYVYAYIMYIYDMRHWTDIRKKNHEIFPSLDVAISDI